MHNDKIKRLFAAYPKAEELYDVGGAVYLTVPDAQRRQRQLKEQGKTVEIETFRRSEVESASEAAAAPDLGDNGSKTGGDTAPAATPETPAGDEPSEAAEPEGEAESVQPEGSGDAPADAAVEEDVDVDQEALDAQKASVVEASTPAPAPAAPKAPAKRAPAKKAPKPAAGKAEKGGKA